MKIDILVGVAYRGGVEEVINAVGKYLQRKGHDLRIVHGIWQGMPWADDSISFHILLDVEKGQWTGDYNDLARAYREFLEVQGYPEVVLAAGWPVLVPIARVAVQRRAKVVSWLHGDINAYIKGGFGGFSELSYADAHFCINKDLAQNIAVEIQDSWVFQVRNPVNLDRICFNERRDIHRLSFVGRLATEKRIPYMLQTFALTDDSWILDIIGDTDAPGGIEALDEYCTSLGIENRVFFHGWQENPWKILENSGALLLTSEREGSPLVVLEALLCGMFVISTPTVGANEIISPGENGFFVPFDDLSALPKLLWSLDSGQVSVPDSQICRKSASYLLQEEELSEFENYLLEVSQTHFQHTGIPE